LGLAPGVDLKVLQHDLRLAHTWTIARGGSTDITRVVIVRLTDGDGTFGVGEASPVSRYDESAATVQDFCARVDASRLSFNDVPRSMRYLDSIAGGNMSAKCALNIALLDGAAKRAGKAVCDFLDLGFAEGRHITSFSIGIDSPDVIREKVRAADAFPVLKLKVGGPDDRRNLDALREAAPKKPVRVDANEGWATREQALEMIEWLARDGHVEFVEQPMPAASSPENLAWLKTRSPLPLFADEACHTARDIPQCAEGYHGVNVKLGKAGGISGAYDVLQAARGAGMKTMIGCMIETSVLITAAAHLAGLADHLDLDGNLLITNDPYRGVTAERGILSFAGAPAPTGLRVASRD
jgi:L-alanine-DL-glutamate epimerase-like enolase superfamily enzyme